jgi:hypothetical protein
MVTQRVLNFCASTGLYAGLLVGAASWVLGHGVRAFVAGPLIGGAAGLCVGAIAAGIAALDSDPSSDEKDEQE